MTMKKTVQAPVTSDGVPIVIESHPLDKTRELRPDEPDGAGAPREVIDDEITVPVQSSIESTVTFEMLRRQSREDDEE
jgi:hypothetical protein